MNRDLTCGPVMGSSFTLMTFLTSILLGLCMGSGAVFSIRFGQRDGDGLREGAHASFVLIAGLTVVLNAAAFLHPLHRGSRHLVGSTHRMGAGRPDRAGLLPAPAKGPVGPARGTIS